MSKIMQKISNVLLGRQNRHQFILQAIREISQKDTTKPIRIAEIGIWSGTTTKHVLKKARQITEYIGIDNYPTKYEKLYSRTNLMQKAKQAMKENTKQYLNFKWINKSSTQAAKQFPNKYFDIIFIDANHCYKYVKEDIKTWLPKIKEKGIMCGDDYSITNFGVIQAVNEAFNGKKHIIINSGMWKITKKSKRENERRRNQ